jgi:hypothetical protein
MGKSSRGSRCRSMVSLPGRTMVPGGLLAGNGSSSGASVATPNPGCLVPTGCIAIRHPVAASSVAPSRSRVRAPRGGQATESGVTTSLLAPPRSRTSSKRAFEDHSFGRCATLGTLLSSYQKPRRKLLMVERTRDAVDEQIG